MNPSQVKDIGDHDYCVVLTQTQTLWLNNNWNTFHKQGKLDWAFKELVKLVLPNGRKVIQVLNILNTVDYQNVRWLLNRAAAFKYCFVYAVDGVGKVPIIGKRWRHPRLRAVKDENHVKIMGIMPNHYVWVEQKDKDQKYVKVYGYQ